MHVFCRHSVLGHFLDMYQWCDICINHRRPSDRAKASVRKRKVPERRRGLSHGALETGQVGRMARRKMARSTMECSKETRRTLDQAAARATTGAPATCMAIRTKGRQRPQAKVPQEATHLRKQPNIIIGRSQWNAATENDSGKELQPPGRPGTRRPSRLGRSHRRAGPGVGELAK